MTWSPTTSSETIGQGLETSRIQQPEPRRVVISPNIIDILVAGLELTEASLDYTEIYTMHKQAADEGLLPNRFDPIMPRFAAAAVSETVEHIRREAHRTVHEFNMIARHIGGIPVKIENERDTDTLNGIITGLRSYDEGQWTYVFSNMQHPDLDVRGDTQKLKDWHQATISSPVSLMPEQFEPQQS